MSALKLLFGLLSIVIAFPVNFVVWYYILVGEPNPYILTTMPLAFIGAICGVIWFVLEGSGRPPRYP